MKIQTRMMLVSTFLCSSAIAMNENEIVENKEQKENPPSLNEENFVNLPIASAVQLGNWFQNNESTRHTQPHSFGYYVKKYYNSKPFGITVQKETQGVIQKILETEEKHKNWIVAYHALPMNVAVAIDILSALRSILSQQKSFAYRFDSVFKKIKNLETYFLTQYNEGGGWRGEKDRVICETLSLFGGLGNSGDSAFYYWLSEKGGWSDVSYQQIFEAILKEIGFPPFLWKDYEKLQEDLIKDNILQEGCHHLLQFFIAPQHAKKASVIYWPGGASATIAQQFSLGIPMDSPSLEEVDDLVDKLPLPEFENVEDIQNYMKNVFLDDTKKHGFEPYVKYYIDQKSPVTNLFKLSKDCTEVIELYRRDPNTLNQNLRTYHGANVRYLLRIQEKIQKVFSSTNSNHEMYYDLKDWIKEFQKFIKKIEIQANVDSIDYLQLRMLVKPEVVNNPNIIKIKRYWALPQDSKKQEEYQKRIYDVVAQHINLLVRTVDSPTIHLDSGDSTIVSQIKNPPSHLQSSGELIMPQNRKLRNAGDIKKIYDWVRDDDVKSLRVYFKDKMNTPHLFDVMNVPEPVGEFTATDVVHLAISKNATKVLTYLISKIVTSPFMDIREGAAMISDILMNDPGTFSLVIKKALEKSKNKDEFIDNLQKDYIERVFNLCMSEKTQSGRMITPKECTEVWRFYILLNGTHSGIRSKMMKICDLEFVKNKSAQIFRWSENDMYSFILYTVTDILKENIKIFGEELALQKTKDRLYLILKQLHDFYKEKQKTPDNFDFSNLFTYRDKSLNSENLQNFLSDMQKYWESLWKK